MGAYPQRKIRALIPGAVGASPRQRISHGKKDQKRKLCEYMFIMGIKIPVSATRVEIRIYFPDNRRADMSNKIESLMDLMVDCCLLIDDSWQHTGTVEMIPCGIDRDNPRAEITILTV